MNKSLSRRHLLTLAAATLTVVGCDRLPGGGNAKPAFSAIDITGAQYASKLELTDADGRLRTLADFKGKAVIVFFGFTQCPDVCPTTLAEIAEVKKLLGADGAKVQPLFITLDPERDTAAVLKAYVGNFGADFVALRGSLEQTQATAKEFKIFFAKVAGKTDGSYTMDHTAGSFVFDPQGRVRLFVRQGGGAAALANDTKLLLAGA